MVSWSVSSAAQHQSAAGDQREAPRRTVIAPASPTLNRLDQVRLRSASIESRWSRSWLQGSARWKKSVWS